MRLILQVDQEGIKEMKTILSIIGILVLGFFLLMAAGISPAVGETNKLGGDERPVMEASETPSFGTEDWVGPEKQDPVVAMKTPSFGTEDWTGTMEFSEALGAGAIPEPAPEKLNLDDYNPD
jgi:hypothetical protein